MHRHRSLTALVMLLAISPAAGAAALDDIKIEVSRELCEGAGSSANNFIVYASNSNSSQTIDANFKYDSNPARQHFILFDADLKPTTDRFPKFHVRRLGPGESARIGCTETYRAAPSPPGPLSVPIVIAKQSAAYVDANTPGAAPDDARSFAAYLLQGGINQCAAGAQPPGLFYLVNLHPYARLSAQMNLLNDHSATISALTANLPPFGAMRVGCSNGSSWPGPVVSAALDVPFSAAAAAGSAAPPPAAKNPSSEQREPQAPAAAPPLAPLSLGAVMRTQNVCAGSVASGWIKINDAWNPTVCGKPATIAYNVWIIQQLSDEPLGAVIHACKGSVPSGWSLVGSAWNPTVCGHPATNQSNVMVIKRLE